MKSAHLEVIGLLVLGAPVFAAPPAGKTLCSLHPSECSLSKKERGIAFKKESEDELRTSAAAPVPASVPSDTVPVVKASKHVLAKGSEGLIQESGGNLPEYLRGPRVANQTGEKDSVVIVAEKVTGSLLSGLRAGDVLTAVLDQSVKASPSVPTPIRARVLGGKWNGAYVLGTATLDKELKRILFTFERMRLKGIDTAYALKATGLAPSGQVGLEGEHHTQEGTYFLAELGAAAVAGYADATTTHSQNIWGNYQTQPSPDNALKQGAAQAASKSSERFAERARNAPEYTEIEAGRELQIIIQESPTEVSGS